MIIGHLGQFAEFIRRLYFAFVVCFFPEIVAPKQKMQMLLYPPIIGNQIF